MWVSGGGGGMFRLWGGVGWWMGGWDAEDRGGRMSRFGLGN